MPDLLPLSREAVSARLVLIRKAYGLSQAEWCRRVDITRATWNNYERGQSRIRLDEALKVVNLTGVGLDFIYRGEEAMLPSRIAEGIGLIKRQSKLFDQEAV